MEPIILFSSTGAHTEITKELKTRLSESITIQGTLKYDAFIPNENGQLQLKNFLFVTKFDLLFKKVVKPAVQNTTKNAKKRRTT